MTWYTSAVLALAARLTASKAAAHSLLEQEMRRLLKVVSNLSHLQSIFPARTYEAVEESIFPAQDAQGRLILFTVLDTEDRDAVKSLSVSFKIPDEGLCLGFLETIPGSSQKLMQINEESVQNDLAWLRQTTENALALAKADLDPNQNRLVHHLLSAEIPAIVKRRAATASAWLEIEVEKFQESDGPDELRNTLSVMILRLEACWMPCPALWGHCYLPCTMIGQHAEHVCRTDHKCHEDCDFCGDQHGSECDAAALYVCASKAGHEGRHMCKEKMRACGGEYHMFGFSGNCAQTCNRPPNHEGECDCGVAHLCGAPCDLPGCHLH